MLLKQNEKLHIIERRLFSDDVRRHFIGEVIECSDFAVRITGYVWVHDYVRGVFVRRSEERERIFFLGDRLTINVLPAETDLAAIVYEADPEKGLRVTDQKSLSLEITEFSAMR